MISETILEKYRQIPHSPGVYLMKDAGGKTIYVGKAKDLKKKAVLLFRQKKTTMTPKPLSSWK